MVMLHAEKERVDESERKYVEAQGSTKELRKKLAETEKRVYQLQDSLNSFGSDSRANGTLVRVLIHMNATKYLSFKAVDGSFVYNKGKNIESTKPSWQITTGAREVTFPS